MSATILSAIRRLPQLRTAPGSLRTTAIELAHLASGAGKVRVAHRYLAYKCCRHPRTIQRHLPMLEAMHIIHKRKTWLTPWRCDINEYAFNLPLLEIVPKRVPYDSMSPTLPPQEEREKSRSLREDLARQKKGLRFWTPGSEQWQKTCEEIARLEGLLRC